MCCRNRRYARQHGACDQRQRVVYVRERRPTLLRRLVEHIMNKHQEQKALQHTSLAGPKDLETEYRDVEVNRTPAPVQQQPRRTSNDWVDLDEKETLRLAEGMTASRVSSRAEELPSYGQVMKT
ncbi:hypothetical protein BGZ60DRAFT_246839 [Tricladium varicosporioides]|nr:hypothetical protein BGZ60DRAFT_246839 [Hymenoscyphus varicosporioides]